jgi:hypothetical protein
MATLWERIQVSAKAAMAAWSGNYAQIENSVHSPFSVYFGLEDEDKQRVERYQLFRKYYAGEHKRFLRTKTARDGAVTDDNVTINLSRRVVNKGASFLFGRPLQWELQEGDTTPEELLLEDIWRSDQWRQSFLQEAAINGGTCGMSYWQIVSNGDGLPRLVNVDPAIIFPRSNPSDIDDMWAYELRWREGESVMRTVHSLQDSGRAWETWTERLRAGRWAMEQEPEVWPWPWPMFVHNKNLPNPNEFFGLSDLEDADLNDAINATASNVNRITRIFAHPVMWGHGFNLDEMDPSKMLIANNPQANLSALELGRDLQSSQDYLRFLRTMFAEITQVPENDPDRLGLGAQSGFALRILFGDLLDKTYTKRNLYGSSIVEANRRLLEMTGNGPDNIVTLHWADPLPVDEQSEMSADKFDLEAGLSSKETMQRKRGYDPETETERIAAQATQTGNIGDALLAAFDRGNTGIGTAL